MWISDITELTVLLLELLLTNADTTHSLTVSQNQHFIVHFLDFLVTV